MVTRQEIQSAIQEYQSEFLEDLRSIMKIESIKATPEKQAPFGVGPKRALEQALKIAEKLGFKTKIIHDAVGYAILGDIEADYIGVFGHLDVVPAGTGWHYPPFDLTEDNGILYGRGILDNKGPALSTLYALYILKQLNVPLTKNIRIVFGTDEESGSADLPLYLSEENPPLYGFTPDCKYPAVYGERGMVGLKFTTTFEKNELAQIKSFVGNFDRSSVPDDLTVLLDNDKMIQVTGKRSPSNAPEMGENVLTKFAVEAVENQWFTGQLNQYFSWIAQDFHEKHTGEGLGIDFWDEDSGKLQLTPYELKIKENQIELFVSIRYPISITKEQIVSQIQKKIPSQTNIEIIRSMDATLFPKNHMMLKVMQEVYEECTGEDGTPVTTTGATYARTMPNIIAFGPSFPGQKGIAHNHDEYMSKEDLLKNMEIYALTLARLGQ